MFDCDHPTSPEIFEYYAPLTERPIGIISVPHAGEYIPPDFVPFLSGNQQAYGCDVDYKVNALIDIDKLRRNGLFIVVAKIHRIAVDLNRSPSEAVLNWKDNTQGENLVKIAPSEEQRRFLEQSFYAPYYEMLKSLCTELDPYFKNPVPFVDLHSMPSRPTPYHMKKNPNQKVHRPDICLSDRHGKTCTKEFIHCIHQDLTHSGYETTINDPYIGGHITEYADSFRTNNIQIEMKRGLYMNEMKRELDVNKIEPIRHHLTDALLNLFNRFGN